MIKEAAITWNHWNRHQIIILSGAHDAMNHPLVLPGPAATEVQLLGAAGNQQHGRWRFSKIVGWYLGKHQTTVDRG